MKPYCLNDKGVALVTTLVLSIIAMALVSIVYLVVTAGIKMSGVEKRYITELDAAKGVAEYVMATLLTENLTCNGSTNPCVSDATCTNPSSNIYIHPNVCTALNKPNCANISACYLNATPVDPLYPSKKVVSVRVLSNNPSNEQTLIEFVYNLY